MVFLLKLHPVAWQAAPNSSLNRILRRWKKIRDLFVSIFNKKKQQNNVENILWAVRINLNILTYFV